MQGSVFILVGGTRYLQQKYKTRLKKALTFFCILLVKLNRLHTA